MKVKKGKWIIVLAIAIVGVILLGGINMVIKKTIKDESYPINDIQSINIRANMADINISLTTGDEIKIIQYSQKKVDETFQYDFVLEGSELTIIDKSQNVPYLFGIQGSPGISYQIELPLVYAGSLNISLNQGDVVMDAEDKVFALGSIQIENTGMGNINIAPLVIRGNSRISTERGNINLTLGKDADCRVNAQTQSGNATIDDAFSDGLYELVIVSKQGNISVETLH